jgi:hypothetical protein
MANGLLDLLGGLGTTPPAYLEGLLGQPATEDLRKRSIGTGLANALVGYLAMPKNQNLGLGRILAGSAQAGMQGAQGVYDTATADYMQQQKIEEMQRAKQQRVLQQQAITQAATQFPEYADAIRANPELLKEIIAAKIKPAESQIAKLNPKDYTPESWAAYINSKNDTTQLREAINPSTADVTNDRNAVAFANFGGKRFSELTPAEAKQVNDYIENSKVRVAGASVPSQQPSFRDATELRKEFRTNPVVKAFDTQENAFKIIKSTMTNPSAAGDLAGVTKFMKLLDPESVVRESEVGLARNATGLYDKLTNYYQNMMSGKILTAPQRADFLDTATNFYNVAREQKKLVENQYSDIAKTGGLDPKLVVGSPTSETSLSSQDMAKQLLEQRKKEKR